MKQALEWDAEGRLASVTQGSQVTTFAYDTSGARMPRKEPGATTLYLPGMELRLDHTSRTVRGTRFYTFGGHTVAVREAGGAKLMAADHQGTQGVMIDASTGAVTRRRMTHLGAP